MPTVEHSTLTTTDLHEPKGIASANSGQVYTADGAGSGTWEYSPLGWGYYLDNSGNQVFGTTATKLSIDGAGTLTNETYLPRAIRGTGSLWDTTNDKILPMTLGDGYDIRIDLPITAITTANELTLQLDVGGGATPTIIAISHYLGLAKTPPFTLSVGFPLVALTSLTVTNGVQLFCSTDAGTCTITNPAILIKRDFDGAL